MNETQDWTDCRPGQLAEMVAGIQHRRRRRILSQVAAVGGVLAILLVAGLFFANSFQPNDLACGDVIPLLAEYEQGRLAPSVRSRVSSHLDHCPGCRRQLERVQDESGAARPADSNLALRLR